MRKLFKWLTVMPRCVGEITIKHHIYNDERTYYFYYRPDFVNAVDLLSALNAKYDWTQHHE